MSPINPINPDEFWQYPLISTDIKSPQTLYGCPRDPKSNLLNLLWECMLQV